LKTKQVSFIIILILIVVVVIFCVSLAFGDWVATSTYW